MKKKYLLVFLLACACGTIQAENVVKPIEVSDTTKVVDVDEIVVVATPKENSRLRQQTLSSNSFSQWDMQQNRITSIKSLSSLVPNLYIPSYGSKLTTAAYIRGIGSRINTPAIGLYVDNIPFVNKNAFDFNYAEIERIDVMRGPQGTLYGRNTMGGLIRVYTKSPFDYQGTDVKLGAATYGDYNASVTHYHRISDRFAFSGGVFYSHMGGFFKNEGRDNERMDKGDEVGARVRAIYLPNANSKLDFTLNYEYLNQGGYPYEYTGVVNGSNETLPAGVGKISYNSESGYKRNLLNAGLNFEHQANRFTFNSITGFQFLRDHMDLDQDFTLVDLYTMMQKQNSKTLSQEFTVKSKPGSRWEWTTGLSGFYQWLSTDGPVVFRQDGVAWINQMMNRMGNQYLPTISQGPMTMSFVFSDLIQGNELAFPGTYHTPTLNGALFHQSTFNDLLGLSGLSLTLGMRFDYGYMKLDYDASTTFTHRYGLNGHLVMPGRERDITLVPEADYRVTRAFQGDLNHDYWQVLPKFALKYDFDGKNNVFASVTKGYRAGGYNIQMFSDLLQYSMRSAILQDVANATIPVVQQQPAIPADTKQTIIGVLSGMAGDNEYDINTSTLYEPEYSWNYEVGSHLTLFDNRLQADLSAFWMDTHNQQLARFSSSGLGRVTTNAGKSRSLGTELSFRTQLTDALSLNGSYGYTYATFDDYPMPTTSNPDNNLKGNYVPFVPKHTYTVGGQYVFGMQPSAWLDQIVLFANYSGAGRIYWTETNEVSQSAYGVLNSRISFRKGKGQIDFWFNNLLNTDYDTFYFETMGRGFRQKSNPLQAGVELRCRF